MTCCETDESAVIDRTICPSCRTPGAAVERITLKALLTADALRKQIPAAPRFCATLGCPVVYFDRTENVTFKENELTVPVHAKHPNVADVPVCYCFGYTPESMREAFSRGDDPRKDVTAEVKAGHCACEVRNPRGECCLGDMVRAEQRLASAVSTE